MKIVKNIFSFLFVVMLLCGGTSVVFGKDVKITIKAPESAWVDQRFELTFILESEVELDTLPQISNVKGIEIIQGPQYSRSYSQSIRNGKRDVRYSLRVTYLLRVSKKGKYVLPVIEALSEGKKYKSDKHEITIDEVKDIKQDEAAFVKTIVSKNSVRPTDTLTVTYKLYTTMEVARIVSMDSQDLTGFYVENMTYYRTPVVEEEIDGKKYKVIELQKLLLLPRKEGVFKIPEGNIEVEFAIPTGKKVQDFWGDVYDETISKVLPFKLDAFTIRVFDYVEI